MITTKLGSHDMIKKSIIVLALAAGVCVPPLKAQKVEPKTHQITIQSFAFVPATLEVRVGDTIEWINRDFAPHTATARNGDWTTVAIENDATGRVIVTKPGTHAYFCKFHPSMTAAIIAN